jgi:integrase
MATVKVILRLQKANKKGEAPLYLRITKDRKPQFISLNYRVHPDNWNEETCRARKSHPNSQRLNNFIASKIAEAEGVALKMEEKSETISTSKIKQVVLGKSSESFIKYFEDYIHRLEKDGKFGTLDKATAVLSKLKVYLRGKDIMFEDIKVGFLKKYDRYLKDELGNCTNTVHSNLKIVRKLFNEAVSEEIIPFENNPFLRYKLKWEKTSKEYLTEEELSRLAELPLATDSMRLHHRNMYLFAAYAGGMRISDVITLTWSEFNGTHVTFTMHKGTNAESNVVSIKLPQKALAIIDHYRKPERSSSEYVFPILKQNKDYSDQEVLFQAISSATAYTNTDLKKLAILAGIDKKLHFHTSRHTWATRALKLGMRMEYVSKLMGHTSIKTTQIYAKIVNQELDKAMDVFDNS